MVCGESVLKCVYEHYSEPFVFLDLKSNQFTIVVLINVLDDTVSFYINEQFKRFDYCSVTIILDKSSNIQYVEKIEKLIDNQIITFQPVDQRNVTKKNAVDKE